MYSVNGILWHIDGEEIGLNFYTFYDQTENVSDSIQKHFKV